MHRRSFLFRASGLALSVALAPSLARAAVSSDDRLGMSTVIFRSRFRQTKPAGTTEIKDELTLLKVPSYYRDRFGVRNLEFWSNHFESLDRAYLEELRANVKDAGAQVVNIQV
ncbi:MAG: hypothetical protein GX535_04155, partial [Xanthomonadaceae bacterium]|nr:hypothetical protein [Xanthomonadaceae bacterium]